MARRAAQLAQIWFLLVLILTGAADLGRAQVAAKVALRGERPLAAPVPDEEFDLPRFALARIGGSRFSAPNEPSSMVVSPDGRQLAVAGVAREVWVFDIQTGGRIFKLEGADEGNLQTAFSPDGKQLAAAGYDGLVRIWSATSGAKLTEFRAHAVPVRFVGFVPRAKCMVTAGADNHVRFWTPGSFDMIESFQCDDGPGDRRVAIDDQLGTVYWIVARRIVRWEPRTTQALFDLRAKHTAQSLQCVSEKKLLCVVSTAPLWTDSAVQVFDAVTAKELKCVDGGPFRFTSARLSPDGGRLATGAAGLPDSKFTSVVKVHDWRSGKVLWQRELSDGFDPTCLNFSPDGAKLFVSLAGNVLRIYDAASGDELFAERHECRDITCVTFARTGPQLLVASGTHMKDQRGRISLWDFSDRRCQVRWQIDCGYNWSAAFSPDGSQLVSHSLDGRLSMRDSRDGRLLWEDRSRLSAEPSMSRKILFRGAGEQLFLPEVSGSLHLIDGAKGTDLGVAKIAPYVYDAAFSRDAAIVALARSNASVALWDVDAGRQVGSLDEHGATVFCVAYAPQDRFLVSGSRDKKLRIWDLQSQKLRLELVGHKGGVTAVAISPDGESLVSSDETGELIIWDARSGRILNRWQNEGPVTSLSLSADGELLACANGRGRVLVWDYKQLRLARN